LLLVVRACTAAADPLLCCSALVGCGACVHPLCALLVARGVH
jgi:hypothetical protein